MFDHLENIRQKNSKQKKLYAFTVAFIFSGLILIIWYISIVPGFIEEGNRDKKVKEIASTPGESFATVIKGGLSIFQEQTSSLKDKINSINFDKMNPPAYFKGTTTPVEPVITNEDLTNENE